MVGDVAGGLDGGAGVLLPDYANGFLYDFAMYFGEDCEVEGPGFV